MSSPPAAAEQAGSAWRRWDPHVHFPGTLHNDQFGDLSISDALDILASRSPSIEAVGVTDYCTTSSYRRVLQAHQEGSGSTIAILFPNVELRLSLATNRDSAVNIHLLCAPDEVDELDRLLRDLEFRYEGNTYRCVEDDLIRLGRRFRADDGLDSRAALREGAMQFKVNPESLEDAASSAWAAEHLLVAVAGGTSDGTSGLQTRDGAFQALRRNIERFSQIIFSGDPKQREFWTGQGADDAETLASRYGGQKLCLHGSDAHTEERLGIPDLDRYCWLRGDPTFDTLKMACLSPETRGFIGARPPVDDDAYGRIAKVTVSAGDWFPESGVTVNPGLVAIIGPRGSGKTALGGVRQLVQPPTVAEADPVR